jgi:hypothetical protein
MGDIQKQVKDAVSGMSGSDQFKIADDLTEVPMMYEVGIALFAIGIVLFIISFLGCCGACCNCCKMLLILFAIALAVIMIIEIVFFALFFQEDSALHSEIKSTLSGKLSNPYDEQNPNAFDLTMNIVNYEFKCCGLSGSVDYGAVVNSSPGRTTPLSCQTYTNGCYDKLQDIIKDNIVYAGLIAAALLALQLLEVIFAVVVYKDSSKVSPI